jgi:bifunctional DNA-binding transcriptional regulator/antitoxin component of YhaV-PrlF toxin-antitoxin module
MQLAKLTDKGQITLSPETRRKLGVRGGDKVVLVERDGGYFMANANQLALQNAQEGFAGEADRLGLNTIDDVVQLIHDVRAGK